MTADGAATTTCSTLLTLFLAGYLNCLHRVLCQHGALSFLSSHSRHHLYPDPHFRSFSREDVHARPRRSHQCGVLYQLVRDKLNEKLRVWYRRRDALTEYQGNLWPKLPASRPSGFPDHQRSLRLYERSAFGRDVSPSQHLRSSVQESSSNQ